MLGTRRRREGAVPDNSDFRTTIIKAIGVVTEPSTDGHRVGVDLGGPRLQNVPVTLPSSDRQSLTKMSDSAKSRQLIRAHILRLLDGPL